MTIVTVILSQTYAHILYVLCITRIVCYAVSATWYRASMLAFVAVVKRFREGPVLMYMW